MRLIDADALIHELNNSHCPGAPYVDAGISIAIGKVCDAPTIKPEPKTGEWIGTEYNGYADGNPIYYEWECSECGCVIEEEGRPTYNYCPQCGADMREEE